MTAATREQNEEKIAAARYGCEGGIAEAAAAVFENKRAVGQQCNRQGEFCCHNAVPAGAGSGEGPAKSAVARTALFGRRRDFLQSCQLYAGHFGFFAWPYCKSKRVCFEPSPRVFTHGDVVFFFFSGCGPKRDCRE